MVSGCQAEHVQGSGVNRGLQRVPVVAGSLVQLTFEGGSEFVLYRREFELVGVESFRDFLSLGSVHGLNILFFTELFLDLICVVHGWSVGVDKGGVTLPAKGELEFHMAIIQTL